MAPFHLFEVSAIFCLLFVVLEVIRRLYFHSLSHIPGPMLAALTRWYEFYFDVIQGGRYVFKIQELHAQDGPIIRITPNELHVNDVGFLDAVYAPSTSRRDKYDYQLKTLRVPGGVGTTANFDLHKKRRDALTPFFSKRNVSHLEPLIAEKVSQLRDLLQKHATTSTPVNLSDIFFAFSNDVVTNFLFAHKTNLLVDVDLAATQRQNSNELLMGININKHFPWIPDFLESLPLSISMPIMPPGLIDMLELSATVRSELVGIMKGKSSTTASRKILGPTGKESVYDSVLDNDSLPPSEKSLIRLEQEGTLLVLAGTESPAKSLKIIFYHLLANTPIISKLRTEINTLPSTASWNQLEQLPYLSAVIEEGNRLSFGVTARQAGIAYQPLTYTPTIHATTPNTKQFYLIPSGTPISITTLSAHTSPSVFPNPLKFNPERWLGDEGREPRKFQCAFSKGGRKCLGIELARAELYLTTAALIRSFEMVLWKTDASDVAFKHDYHVAMPKLSSKGVRVVLTAI